MIFEESHHTRKLIGRLASGEDLVTAISNLCREQDVRAGELRGVGTLRDVEIVQFNPDTKKYDGVLSGDGPFEIVQMNGNVARMGDEVVVRVDVLVAGAGPVAQQLAFGQLREATAEDCEFVVESFEDVEIERGMDAGSGRLAFESIESTAPPERAATAAPAATSQEDGEEGPATDAGSGEEKSSMSWDDAIEASEEIGPAGKRNGGSAPKADRAAEDVYAGLEMDEPLLEAGDVLDHPKLGQCSVIKVEEDEYAHIRLNRGRIRKLKLDLFDIEYVGEDDGKNVFRAKMRK